METFKLTSQVDADGKLKLEVSTHLPGQPVEVLVVIQPTAPTVTAYPLDYFTRLDGIAADDLVERPDQGLLEIRDSLQS